jgi:hypothetical protein
MRIEEKPGEALDVSCGARGLGTDDVAGVLPRGASTTGAPPRRVYLVRAAGIAALFGSFFAVLGSGSVPCSFARATHLPCPGCGSTRSAWALLHGDVLGALRMNPLGPVLAAIVACLGLLTTYHVLIDGTPNRLADTRLGRALPRAAIVVAILEIALWLLRFCGLFGGPVPV